jgi:hypothetical protein
MLGNAFINPLGNIVFAVYLLAAVYIFFSLFRQIRSRKSTVEPLSTPKGFDLPELLLATALVLFLLFNVYVAITRNGPARLDTGDLIANLFFVIAVVLFIAVFLRLRRFDLDLLGGFSKISFVRAASTGVILLFFTYPLLAISESIVQAIFGTGSFE